jgi:hypothetical protein
MSQYTAQQAAQEIALKFAPDDLNMRAEMEASYYKALMKDLWAGQIVGRNPETHLPVPVDHPVPEIAFVVATIRHEDLNRWLKKNRIEVKLTARASTAAAPEPVAKTTSSEAAQEQKSSEADRQLTWEEKALRLANEEANIRFARGEGIMSARSISQAIEEKLRADGNTWSFRGPRTASGIRKGALTGWRFIPGGASGADGAKD